MAGTPMFVVKAYLPVNESFGKCRPSAASPAAAAGGRQPGRGRGRFCLQQGLEPVP